MYKYLEIANKGEIELAALTLMGAHHKDKEDSIGFFGSGNKYALATMIRENVEFRIYSGADLIDIELETVILRGEEFKRVIIDGERTSITTRMGPDWELWFVIREFVANAMDEGEFCVEVVDCVQPVKGFTTIYIELDPRIKDIVDNMHNYMILPSSPHKILDRVTFENSEQSVEILEPLSDKFNVFRRGISVSQKHEPKSLFWYNIHELDINESRVYVQLYQVMGAFARALTVTQDAEIIKKYLYEREGTVEDTAYWDFIHDDFSQTWADILKDKKIYKKSYVRGDDLEDEDSLVLRDSLAEALARQFPELNVIGTSNGRYVELAENYLTAKEIKRTESSEGPEAIEEEITPQYVDVVKDAVENLRQIGHEVEFAIGIVRSVERKEFWIKEGRVLLNVEYIKPDNVSCVKRNLLKCKLKLQDKLNECSVEREDYLIDSLIHYQSQLVSFFK